MRFFFPRSVQGKILWRGPLRLIGLVAVLVALGCAAWAVNGELDERRMIAELKQGGHVVYLRHATRVKGPREKLSPTSTAAEFADCSTQRNLTPYGRDQAKQLGEYWRELGIPVGRVIANAQCRTRDTAMLAFGRAELDPRLYDAEFIRGLISQTPTDATNTVLVSSDSQLRDLTGIELGFAEAAIVKPDGNGGVEVVGLLQYEDWEDAAKPGWW